MTLEIIIVLIVCGCCSNLLSALFGIGGGVLMVPILMTVFPEFSLQMVSATSLSIVITTALINLTYFIRQKIAISLVSLIIWSLGMIVGVQVGFELSFYVPDLIIISIFVITLTILAIKTFLSAKNKAEQEVAPNRRDQILGCIFCTVGGGVAGLTGVGGGSIMAPLIGILPSVKQKQIAVYTNYMMVLGGIGAMYGYLTKTVEPAIEGTYQIGYINFSLIAIVVASSFVTSFFSMKLRGIMRKRTTNICLGCLLIFIAVYTTTLQLLS